MTVAERYREGFEGLGWMAMRLLWMHHETPPPPGPDVAVEPVEYDAVYDLRVAWHAGGLPGEDFAAHYPEAREVALQRDARVLTIRQDGRPIAFAQIERDRHNTRSRRCTSTPTAAAAGAAPR